MTTLLKFIVAKIINKLVSLDKIKIRLRYLVLPIIFALVVYSFLPEERVDVAELYNENPIEITERENAEFASKYTGLLTYSDEIIEKRVTTSDIEEPVEIVEIETTEAEITEPESIEPKIAEITEELLPEENKDTTSTESKAELVLKDESLIDELIEEVDENTAILAKVKLPVMKPGLRRKSVLSKLDIPMPMYKPTPPSTTRDLNKFVKTAIKDEALAESESLSVKSLTNLFAEKSKEPIESIIKEEELVSQLKNSNTVVKTSDNGIVIPNKKPPSKSKIKLVFSKMFDKKEPDNQDIVKKKARVKSGDTLMNILVDQGNLDRKQAYNAIETLKTSYDPRSLNSRQDITLFMKPNIVGEMEFTGMEIKKNTVSSVMLKKLYNDEFITGEIEKDVKKIVEVANGKVTGSLYVSTSNAGIPDNITASFIKALSWTVDFQRDLKKGDKFKVAYEQYVTEDGHKVNKRGNLLYASITLSGRPITIYRFENKYGEVNYYDRKGSAVKKALMKSPISGAKMTSGFGRRRHPISGYTKMHEGIDFAAPKGTPIYAAGSGVIEYLGRNSSFGKYIRIRHKSDLKTAYAHLNGYKKGLKKGSRVKQGQVIGYVGTTGRSTGPHLHYEIIMNGKKVNPRKIKMVQGSSLSGSALKKFKSQVKRIDSRLRSLPRQARFTMNNN